MEIGKTIGVLGSGAWGIAVAFHWSKLGYDVYIWSFEEDTYNEMQFNNHCGAFMPGVLLPKNIFFTKDLEVVFENSSLIFEFIPMPYLRNILEICKSFYIEKKHVIVATAKGVERDTYLIATQVIRETLSHNNPEVFFGGLNTAAELVKNKFSSGIVSSRNPEIGILLCRLMNTELFKVEFCSDIVGIQICVSLKYIISVINGVFSGGNVSKNVMSFFATKCLKEVSGIIVSSGGKIETIFDIVGSLDFFVYQSIFENGKMQVGSFVGRGVSLENLNKSYCIAPEGIGALISIINLGQHLGQELPICESIKDYIISGYSINLIDRINLLTLKNNINAERLLKLNYQKENGLI